MAKVTREEIEGLREYARDGMGASPGDTIRLCNFIQQQGRKIDRLERALTELQEEVGQDVAERRRGRGRAGSVVPPVDPERSAAVVGCAAHHLGGQGAGANLRGSARG